LGCGIQKLFDTEFVLGIDNGAAVAQGATVQANIRADVKELTQFAVGAWDFVFSSFLLHQFPYKEVPAVLREWMRVIKIGGALVLYLPSETCYPKCAEPEREIIAEPGAYPDQKWNVNYERMVAAMEAVAYNWDLEYFEACDADDEYAEFYVFRRLK
jgi:predicted SAM-dependent methyltransferase